MSSSKACAAVRREGEKQRARGARHGVRRLALLVRALALLVPALLLAVAAAASDAGVPADDEEQDELEALEECPVRLLRGLGAHHHPISTDEPLAQRLFDQGLLLAFGSQHEEAERAFRAAASADATCAICFWGVALVRGPRLDQPVDDDDDARVAWQALEEAKSLRTHASERERDYIRALGTRHAEEPPADRGSLDRAYASAMQRLAERYPADADAEALYAAALMTLHPDDLWRDGEARAWTPRIVQVLEGILRRRPAHLLANRLYVQVLEGSPYPERALPAAQRLEEVAPEVGRLLHAPAGLYARLGRWHEASRASARAVAADDAYAAACERDEGDHDDGKLSYRIQHLHALWASTVQEGRGDDALAAARKLAAVIEERAGDGARPPTLQHLATLPLTTLVAFGRWQEALSETEGPAASDDESYARGMRAYARGSALAALGKHEEAKPALAELREAVTEAKSGKRLLFGRPVADAHLEIAALLLEARIAAARGHEDDEERRLAALGRASALDDEVGWSVAPGGSLPAKRALGAALLEADRPDEALTVLLADLERRPETGWALVGVARALQGLERTDEAAAALSRYSRAWAHADAPLAQPYL